MTLLFNKTDKGAEELRDLTSNYFANNNFKRIEVKVMLAEEAITGFISKAVMSKVAAHYVSENYPDGATDEQKFLTELVHYIQMPIAYLATHEYYKANELTHDDNGRKVKIDPETERTPWQWQVDRDDYLSARMYYKTLDRLIAFLDENAAQIAEWKESDARKAANSLFVRNAKEFDRVFPIDESGAFYYAVVPFMQEVERKYISPALGTLASTLKASRISADGIEPEQQEIIDAAVDAIPLLTMSIAIKRFSIQTLPEGVVQNYISDRTDRKASQAAALDHIKEVSKLFYDDGIKALDVLKKMLVVTDDTEPVVSDFIPENSADNKYFRT